MPNYQSIDAVAFWSDPKVLELSERQRFVFLYLQLTAQCPMCGVYELAIPKAALEVGCDAKQFREALDALVRKGRVRWFTDECVVWVVNKWRHAPKSDTVVKASTRVLVAQPPAVQAAFLDYYPDMVEAFENAGGVVPDAPEPPPTVEDPDLSDEDRALLAKLDEWPKFKSHEVLCRDWIPFIRQLQAECPDVDVLQECEGLHDWLCAKKRSRPDKKGFIRTNVRKKQREVVEKAAGGEHAAERAKRGRGLR